MADVNNREDTVKIFISHSSKDDNLISEFIEKILRLGFGYTLSELVYTSRQATGVEPGCGIPDFIKNSLQESTFVLFMISDNYKQSEVCLNEMGAAWALGKNVISILLPNTGFEKLGWLTSFEKALRIDDSEDLDELYEKLHTSCSKLSDWGKQRDSFLKYCREDFTMSVEPISQSEIDGLFAENSEENDLKIFDTAFYVRAVEEGEFQFQLNLRMRAEKDICIKEFYLMNKDAFTASGYIPKKEVRLRSYIPYDYVEINNILPENYSNVVTKAFETKRQSILDTRIEKNSQRSFSFNDLFMTARLCDGYDDLPKENWSIRITYNIDQVVEIPITLMIANYNDYRHLPR